MDKWSHLISYSEEKGFWKILKAGRNGPLISHLIFLDDILLFVQDTKVQMQCVLDIVNQFCPLPCQQVI